mmetsp:Transcript_100684/g.285318  ORF Transcript_100684/g.285318 Transcript_100684/m.285318 type:complete len:234 (+) Transcript_100684:166-867(+)
MLSACFCLDSRPPLRMRLVISPGRLLTLWSEASTLIFAQSAPMSWKGSHSELCVTSVRPTTTGTAPACTASNCLKDVGKLPAGARAKALCLSSLLYICCVSIALQSPTFAPLKFLKILGSDTRTPRPRVRPPSVHLPWKLTGTARVALPRSSVVSEMSGTGKAGTTSPPRESKTTTFVKSSIGMLLFMTLKAAPSCARLACIMTTKCVWQWSRFAQALISSLRHLPPLSDLQG